MPAPTCSPTGSAFHAPDRRPAPDTWQSQAAALAYADQHIGRLVDGLATDKPWLVIMCADHGDAFGEDGYHGRGIIHPTVTDVPFACTVVGPGLRSHHDPLRTAHA
ncbi:hypothetical protein EH183_41910 [Streptomyces sp. CB01881]|uniref:sulfatase-like hydrolase/transferase n=1 Tax=Streptomyces sp. CB01881 TaxID=2078691 RepID=UPI0011DF3E2F|nr:sulfatase-like hydrolase/transferase [Streptomyces sp. CB01881]TYC66553.1 hypothetical protein EH183_41910 [Streptomyces sp. CB01881]